MPLKGGIPKGTIIGLSGVEHSGKTLFATLCCSDVLRDDPEKAVVYIDAENYLDIDWHTKMNHLDLTRFYYVQTGKASGEQILDMVSAYLQCEDVGLVVIDSIPALKPECEWVNDFTKDNGMQGTMAKKYQRAFPIFKGIIAENNSNIVLINQVRDKQVQVGPRTINVPEEACGKAFKYYCDIIFRFGKKTFTKKDNLDFSPKDNDPADGMRLKYKVVKNKTSSNYDNCGGYITYREDTGLDVVTDLIEGAIDLGFIKQAGAYYTLCNPLTKEPYKDVAGKELKFQGKSKMQQYLEENEDFATSYIQLLSDVILNSTDKLSLNVDTSDINEEQKLLDGNEEDKSVKYSDKEVKEEETK